VLPDFPHLKTKLSKFLVARMKSVHESHSVPFGNISRSHIQEGNCVKMVRADGSEETIQMKHHHTEIRISDEELENLSPEEVHRKFDEAAREMARQTSQTFFETVEKGVKEVGNVVRFAGHLTIGNVFDFYEKVLIDFDDNGRPELPTIICGKDMMEQFQGLCSEIESDPETKKRFAALIARKKEEWRDREASRRLVG
jgi:hypothetical protein